MKLFLKTLFFLLLASGLAIGSILVIRGATPQGNIKVNPILGHDLDLDAKYYAQADNNTIHDITTEDISISAWVKVDVDMPSGGTLNKWFSKLQTATPFNGYAGYFTNYKVGTTITEPTANGGSSFAMLGNTAINDNKWHYIAVIFDRDNGTNSKIYLDGIDNTASRTGIITDVDTLANNGLLGTSYTGVHILDGQIRDVKLYYAAGDHWTDEQILHQAQHPFDYTSNAGTLTDYWRLDEGTGTTLYGKVNNLTLSNVLAWTTQPKIKMAISKTADATALSVGNPVGWWKFDETTAIHGSLMADSSGNGNTGTLTTYDGATEKSVVGKLGRAVDFDGSNDFVTIGNATQYITPNSSEDITISAWVKPNIINRIRRRVVQLNKGSGTTAFASMLDPDDNFAIGYSNTANGYASVSSNTIGVIGTWYHIVGVKDNNVVTIYIDGVLKNTNTDARQYVLLTDEGSTSHIGYIASQLWNGLIDDVRIFDRALSAGEVAQMYNSTKDGYLGNIKVSTGLVGWWKMDDNADNTTVRDYSGKNNNGTFSDPTGNPFTSAHTAAGQVGGAMTFDGVDDYVDVGSGGGSELNNAKEMSVSAWVKPNAFTDQDGIVAKYQDSDTRWMLKLNGTSPYNKVWFQFRADVHGESVNTLSASIWTHLVVVYNGNSATDADKIKMYFDGVASDISFSGTIPSFLPNITGNLYIGWDPIKVERRFNGLIDDVKIWNYARTAEQIKQDYERGSVGRE